MSLYDTGIRPIIDQHLSEEAEKVRDYGDYWSASSAGYCYRRLIFQRLQIPEVSEDARKQRVFSSGHIFHEWIQKITKDSGLSIAQELELQDEELKIRGHVDDLILVPGFVNVGLDTVVSPGDNFRQPHLVLYDYKTAHSKWFEYAKSKPVSYYNRMQVGTYMYMLRQSNPQRISTNPPITTKELSEARVLKISKDDLRLFEYQILWDKELEGAVFTYWNNLDWAWRDYQTNWSLPECTCHKHENGFLAREKYNPYFYEGQPCSEAWLRKHV
jgi:hypothetical protein